MHVVFLDAFRDLSQSGSYTCEATALVHMYDNLNDVSKSSGRQLVEYITLLQVIVIEFDLFFCFLIFLCIDLIFISF